MAEIDTSHIRETALRLAKNAEGLQKRFFLSSLSLGGEPRIKVLRGFRGVGKTTALLQMMRERAAYFSMDNPLCASHGLYKLGRQFILDGNTLLLIDEVHHYADWKRDTKALYDEFPGVSMVVSGSAPLAFEPERRYEIIDVEPLSLRESSFLQGKDVPTSEAWRSQEDAIKLLAENPGIYENYKNYLEGGAFPTYFSYKEKTPESIFSSMQKSIREDAIFLPKVDGGMIAQMQKAVVFLATSSLGEFSINSLSKTLEMEKNKAYYMVSLLQAMKILRLVKPYGKGAKLVRGEPKLMFYHPLLRKAACAQMGKEADRGAMREELAVFFLRGRGWHTRTIKGMKKSPDFIIEKGKERLVIEIGGDSKGRAQLKGFSQKTLLLGEKQLIAAGLY